MDPDLAFLLSGAAPTANAVQGVSPPVQSNQQAMMSGAQTVPAQDPNTVITPAQAPAVATDLNASTPVDGVEIHAPPNYNNSAALSGVQRALSADAPVDAARDPGPSHGIWGLLPSNMQHGTLRNVLGSIGDAFLLGSGKQAQYTPVLQQRQIGNAMAGYQTNPQSAIERIAATGAPGSDKMAQSLEESQQNLQMRKAIAEQNNQYRNSQIQSRNDSIIARMAPTVAGWAQNAKTPQDYQAAYQRADAAAKRVDPSASAADFGYVDPKDWQPNSMQGVGATTGQILRNQTGQQSIAERATAAQQASDDRMYHYTHPNYQPRSPTTATIDQGIIQKLNAGQPLSAGEQQYWQHRMSGGHGGTRQLPPNLIVQNGGGQQNHQYQNGQTYRDAKGNVATYMNGQWVTH
jgi:hypothetical protein